MEARRYVEAPPPASVRLWARAQCARENPTAGQSHRDWPPTMWEVFSVDRFGAK